MAEQRITFASNERIDGEWRPTRRAGVIEAWLIVPDTQQTGAYGEGQPITYYNPSAIVKTDEGTYVVARVEDIWWNNEKEGN